MEPYMYAQARVLLTNGQRSHQYSRISPHELWLDDDKGSSERKGPSHILLRAAQLHTCSEREVSCVCFRA